MLESYRACFLVLVLVTGAAPSPEIPVAAAAVLAA
jgi:hypothetical protein